jgi:prepilin-type N-terminal cleavage/methylation domain-containing protein
MIHDQHGIALHARRRRPPGSPGSRGFTLVELLFALGLFLVLSAIAVPAVLASLDRSRARAAARFLSARMALARSQAVARSGAVALRFAEDAGATSLTAYADGNGNGVRSRDIESGDDPLLDVPVRLSDLFPGVVISSLAIGSSGLVSFTPDGTATSGTIVIRGRGGTEFAVRVFGVTGRTRVLRYDTGRREFVGTF